LWNGNWGRVYFYQSELPYDAPNQSSWTHNGVNGYASYEVASSVTSHQAYGLGIYGVFNTSNVKCFNTIETPTNQQVNVHDMINVLITAQTGSEMTHINFVNQPVLPSWDLLIISSIKPFMIKIMQRAIAVHMRQASPKSSPTER
jgi:hypothetical protein